MSVDDDLEIYGDFKSGNISEHAVKATLLLWWEQYMRVIEGYFGITSGNIKNPRQIDYLSEFEKWPEEVPPVVAIVSPGLHEDPARDGRGSYRARWSIFIAAIVSGQSRTSSRNNAQLYGLAIRAIMLQKQSLGGIATGVGWVEEIYTDGPRRKARTLATVQSQFWVEMEDVVNDSIGPVGPVPPGIDGPWTVERQPKLVINDEEVA